MTLPDGAHETTPQVERWLVGAAMVAQPQDVKLAAAVVEPRDFRDPFLGECWGHLPFMDCPCAACLTRAMGEQWAPDIVELAFREGAYLYSSAVCLEAHATIVRKEGEKRRALQAVVAEANEKVSLIRAGVEKVVPIYMHPDYQDLDGAV